MVVGSIMKEPTNNEAMAMEEPSNNWPMCRICAATDIRMHNIENTRLQTLYEVLADAEHDEDDGSPKVVCYMCYPLLVKCGHFADMIKNSERNHTKINNIEKKDHLVQADPSPLHTAYSHLSKSEVKFMVIDTRQTKTSLKDLIVFENCDDEDDDATVKDEITIEDEQLIGEEIKTSDLITLRDNDGAIVKTMDDGNGANDDLVTVIKEEMEI